MGFFRRSSDPPTKDQFAKQFLAAVRRAGEKRKIKYDAENFLLTTADERPRRMFLGNIYGEYCSADKQHREKALARFVRSWFVAEQSIPDEFEDASHDLLPAVRERAYFELAALMMEIEGGEGSEIPYHPIGDHLAVALVYDLPDAMQTIPQSRLESWGVTLYEAQEVARHNLSKLPHAFIGPEQGDGVYMSMTNDNYDACRLLLVDIIRQFRVKGDPVAMVPNRDTLIVTGEDDVDGIRIMIALANDALKKPRPMSGLALRLDGDEWVTWMPPASHPSYGELHGLAIRARGQHYHEQKQLLDKLHAKQGIDIFTASLTAMQDTSTGTIWTYCVWANGVEALLPRTDKIAFLEKDQQPLLVDWERAMEEVGDLMEEVDMYPPRFRVREFPAAEQIEAMRS
jgi:hypothetical protein